MSKLTDWDAESYVTVERLLFELDDALRRIAGWSTRPRVPRQTGEALARAWSLGVDMAQVLYEERNRLVQAKVEYDLGENEDSA